MQSLKVNEEGQILIPESLVEKFFIPKGMEFNLIKRNGELVLKPTPIQAFREIQNRMEGEAEKIGWNSDDDAIDYMIKLRKESFYNNANND